MSNDTSGSLLSASLGRRYSGGLDRQTTRCFKFIPVSLIPMQLGDIGREAGGMHVARHRPTTHGHVLKVISAALFCVG